eukprot:scaffold28210_cov28-Tisochrysis_lutea.AAC.2
MGTEVLGGKNERIPPEAKAVEPAPAESAVASGVESVSSLCRFSELPGAAAGRRCLAIVGAPGTGGVGGRCASAVALSGGFDGSLRKPTSTVAAKPVFDPVMRDSSISKRWTWPAEDIARKVLWLHAHSPSLACCPWGLPPCLALPPHKLAPPLSSLARAGGGVAERERERERERELRTVVRVAELLRIRGRQHNERENAVDGAAVAFFSLPRDTNLCTEQNILL